MKNKWIVVLLLATFVMISARPVGTQPSYYASQWFADVLIEGQAGRIYNFTTQQNGVVTLTGDTFIPNVEGLITVSGECELKRPGVLNFTLEVVTPEEMNDMDYKLHDGGGVASFSITFPATPFYLEGWQTSGIPNAQRVRCIVLVEKAGS